MTQTYTPEQIKDIEERELKAIEFLKSIQMTASVKVVSVNIGDNTFAHKLFPYLADLKFTEQPGDVKSNVLEEIPPAEVVEGEKVDEIPS